MLKLIELLNQVSGQRAFWYCFAILLALSLVVNGIIKIVRLLKNDNTKECSGNCGECKCDKNKNK